MVYANLETEDVRYFTENWEWPVLKVWFDDLMERYYRWLSFQADWTEQREASLKKLVFPMNTGKDSGNWQPGYIEVF